MPTEPKHRQISRDLLAEIAAGKYAPSGRLPSEAQLVRRFGVSRPTVARALRDLQDAGLVERRVGSGSFARQPSAPAGRRRLGLLVPGLGQTEVLGAVCGELAALSRGHDLGLVWGGGGPADLNGEAGAAAAEAACGQFAGDGVAGVFFAPFEYRDDRVGVNRRVADRLQQAGLAVVLLDRDVTPFPERSGFDLVGVDNFAGGHLAADHLLKLGCRRIVYAAPPHSAPTVDARIAGARAAVLARGLPAPADFVREGDPADPAFARSLVGRGKADAIVCANDRVAAELLRSFARAGVQVPNDVRLVGFDDVRFAALVSVPLTTVHQPCRAIAVTAFRAMLDRLADPTLPPRGLTLAPRLTVRESCGAYLNAAAG